MIQPSSPVVSAAPAQTSGCRAPRVDRLVHHLAPSASPVPPGAQAAPARSPRPVPVVDDDEREVSGSTCTVTWTPARLGMAARWTAPPQHRDQVVGAWSPTPRTSGPICVVWVEAQAVLGVVHLPALPLTLAASTASTGVCSWNSPNGSRGWQCRGPRPRRDAGVDRRTTVRCVMACSPSRRIDALDDQVVLVTGDALTVAVDGQLLSFVAGPDRAAAPPPPAREGIRVATVVRREPRLRPRPENGQPHHGRFLGSSGT